MEINFESELRYISSKLGNAPRKFSWFERLVRIRCDKPSWDWKNNELAITINNWYDIYKYGTVAWGKVIQANVLMFSEGIHDCPGELIVCKDNFSYNEIVSLAHDLYSLKGNSDDLEDLETKDYAMHLEDEHTHRYGIDVPKSIINKDKYFISTIYFQRKHLPNKYISNGLVPVLYLDQLSNRIVTIPHQYWSEEFKNWWIGE